MNENDIQRKSVYWRKFEIEIESNILQQNNKDGNVNQHTLHANFILSLQKRLTSTHRVREP